MALAPPEPRQARVVEGERERRALGARVPAPRVGRQRAAARLAQPPVHVLQVRVERVERVLEPVPIAGVRLALAPAVRRQPPRHPGREAPPLVGALLLVHGVVVLQAVPVVPVAAAPSSGGRRPAAVRRRAVHGATVRVRVAARLAFLRRQHCIIR